MSSLDVWEKLKQQGLVSGDKPSAVSPDTPWYVKTLLAFCGWLAAIFIFGFLAVGIVDLLENAAACLLVGVLLLAGAYKFLSSQPSVFVEHLALAVSLAGQALLAVVLFEHVIDDELMAWLSLCLLQLGLACLMPNFVHRVFSAGFSAFALTMTMVEVQAADLAASLIMLPVAWLWLNEFRYPRSHRQLVAIATGLTLALVLIKSSNIVLANDGFWRSSTQINTALSGLPVAECINTAVLLFVCFLLLRRYQSAWPSRLMVMTGAIIFSAASFQAQGLNVSLIILLLGFAASNRLLRGLGLASMTFYISAYYYQLQITLLEKAGTLLLVSILSLAAYALLRWLQRQQGAHHG